MNSQLEEYARKQLKEGLKKCPEGSQDMFKRIYANGDTSLSIDEVVDVMDENRLENALDQVSRTLEKAKR